MYLQHQKDKLEAGEMLRSLGSCVQQNRDGTVSKQEVSIKHGQIHIASSRKRSMYDYEVVE